MDSAKMSRIHQVLEKMRVLPENESSPPPIFVLGSFCRRVTFYSQQVRGLNSAYALVHGGVVSKGGEVAVIGAGAAGTAAAAGLLALGVRVTLIERHQEPFSRQRVCLHRELHPHIYDWPSPIALESDAKLPLLNWKAEDASRVVDDLTVEWDKLAKPAIESGQLTMAMMSKLVSFTRSQRPRLSWQSIQKPQHDKEFDAVIVAVGFGEDRRQLFGQSFTSYWDSDKIEQIGNQRILISGNGDGGLIDVVRCLLNQFRQRLIIERLDLNNLDMVPTHKALLAIEKAQRQKFNYGQMVTDYRRIVAELPPRLKTVLEDPSFRRQDRTLHFHSRDMNWFNLNTSILNRFLAFILIDNNACVTKVTGEVMNVESRNRMGKDEYTVLIAGSEPIIVDQAILRWGAESEFDKSVVLNTAIGKQRAHYKTYGYNDPTIEPLWDNGAEFGGRDPDEFDSNPVISPTSPPTLPPTLSSQSPKANTASVDLSLSVAPFGALYYPGIKDTADGSDLQFESLQRVAVPLNPVKSTSNSPPRIIWRAAVRGVLAEIEDMAVHLEERIRTHVRLRLDSRYHRDAVPNYRLLESPRPAARTPSDSCERLPTLLASDTGVRQPANSWSTQLRSDGKPVPALLALSL